MHRSPQLYSILFLANALMNCAAHGGAPIPIINAGFELQAYSPCSFGPQIAGWTVPSGGVWHVMPCWSSDYPDGIPEGLQIGFSNQGDLSQTLTATLQPNVQYTLRVAVGRRASCCPMQDYKVQLRAGNVLLAEDPGVLEPAPGTFDISLVPFIANAGHPAIGQPIEIRLVRQTAGQNNFDDVRLETGVEDCNDNGIHDPTEIVNGSGSDINANGVLDACEGICPGDIAPPPNGDNIVNVDDLLLVINSWGACAACPADVAPQGGNGQVNVDDLLSIINAWGPCR